MDLWTPILSEGGGYTFWIRGIYKIVSYREGEYHAYFIRDIDRNWGYHPSNPPDDGKYGKCWQSFESAQAACDRHAITHQPAKRTIRRAEEILQAHLEKAAR